MNKELKKLKKLAERHFYRGKSLTKEERFILENSPFASMVIKDKADYSFYKVLEQYGEANNISQLSDSNYKAPSKNYKKRYINMSVNRRYLIELIDDVEEEFGLGAFNRSLYKFENVEVNRLKQYIDYHCRKNMIDKEYPGTCNQLSKVIEDQDNAYDIMYQLYMLQR